MNIRPALPLYHTLLALFILLSTATMSFAAVGDDLQQFSLGATVSDDQLLGVDFDGTHFWVTGGNSNTDPNKLYKLDSTGMLAAVYDQPAACTGWGGRDIAFDGLYLYFGCDDGFIHQIDRTTGTEVGTIPSPTTPARALAYDPVSDHFWTANWNSTIYEIDRTGAIINSFPAVGLSTYGMAWDAASPEGPYLWLWSQDGATGHLAAQMDPSTGSLTGVSFEGIASPAGIAGGAGFSTAIVPGKGTLLGMHQTTPDILVLYEICDVQTTAMVTPVAGPGGSISPATAQTVDYNQTTSFTVIPSLYYLIGSVTGCGGTLVGSTYTTGPITADCTVAASFVPWPTAGTPASLSASPRYPSRNDFVNLSWGASATAGVTYELERSVYGGSFVRVYQGPLTTFREKVYTLPKGQIVYRVRAVKDIHLPSPWRTAQAIVVR